MQKDRTDAILIPEVPAMILQETKKVMRRKEIDYIFAVGVITLMTGLSEYLHEPEIIFPEIAALTAGALAAPAQTWKVNKRQMTGYIAICAIIGVCIVRYLEIGHWGQMTVAFAAGQLIFLCSKTTFAPMISAAVLPVLLQTESWIYPISAVSLTGIVCILQSISVKAGVHQKVNYVPADPVSTAAVKKGIKRTVCGAFLAAAALATDWKFAAAPPLLVAFTEFTGKPKGAGKEV